MKQLSEKALQAAKALKSISRNEEIKAYIERTPSLYKPLLNVALRYIGGETLTECMQTGKEIQKQGHLFTIDFMGESARDEKTINEAMTEFERVIDAVAEQKLQSSVSLDLSHIGLVLDQELAYTNILKLAKKAQRSNLEIMISMEGADRTEDILQIYKRLHTQVSNVGITLQAYLHRTAKDLPEALKLPGKIRLVKGAYEASSTVALPLGEKTDKKYMQYVEQVLKANHLVSLATHDEDLLDYTHKFIQNSNGDKEKIEFEMLKGVTPELLNQMKGYGYKTRVYLPYGKEWYLYLCHRLAENPENIYQALIDIVDSNDLLHLK